MIAPARRMRRLRDSHDDEYDELPCGLLRRRLRPGEDRSGTTPYPVPMPESEIEALVGPLVDVSVYR